MLMLEDLIDDLVEADTNEERERLFTKLRRMGIDRKTACILAQERINDDYYFENYLSFKNS